MDSNMINLNNIRAAIAGAKAAATNVAAQGSGEVGKREAGFLNQQADAVQTLVDNATADGFVDDKEMAAINKAVKQLGRDAQSLTHNFAGGSVDGRQDNTARRAGAGAKDGSLTADEQSSINQKQADVNALIGNARLDGKITGAEQKQINQAQRALSKEIYQGRHNDQGVDLSSKTTAGRQSALRSQVDQAVQNGTMNAADALRLTNKLNMVDQLISGAKADGWIDPAEQRAINQAQAGVEQALAHLNPQNEAAAGAAG